MKLVKPQMLGFLQQTLEVRGRFSCALGVPLLFELGSEPKLLPEVELWKFLATELPGDTPFDPGVPKARAEYVVLGDAFAPEGKPVPSCHVRVRIGQLEKLLFVSGERRWVHGAPSHPVPFTRVPLRWTHAYGGPGLPQNPVGKGHQPLVVDGVSVHPLPNVEDPRRPVRTLSDRPLPASFAPLDATWAERAQKRGTHDRRWLETRFPGFADDFDWSFFNVSPADQQTTECFRGDEALSFENLHPSQATFTARLPGVQARCFVRRGSAAGALEPVELRLDTLWLFPEHARGVVVFHGLTDVAEDDARDVHEVLIAAEALGAPKPVAHYVDVIARRADPEDGPLASLDDAPLMPEWFAPPPQPELAPSLSQQRADVRAKGRVAEARATAESHGLDADEHAASWPEGVFAPLSLERVPELLREVERQSRAAPLEAEATKQRRLADVRTLVEESGVSWEMIQSEFSSDAPGGPPVFSAEAELARLGRLADDCRASGYEPEELDGYLADEKLRAQFVDAERAMKDAYRTSAHYQNPPRALSDAEAARVRARVVAAHAQGESMAGWDLTAADLSGLSLPGAKLRGALLEAANLAGADLSGAELEQAVLARANLTDTRLAGARLAGTSFGRATLTRADLGPGSPDAPGIDAREAIFTEADLGAAELGKIDLTDANLTGCRLENARLDGARLDGITFHEADLSGSSFRDARLHKASFIGATLDRADLAGACLTLVSFIGCRGEGVRFTGAALDQAAFASECALVRADFRRAKLLGTSLRSTNLARSDFSEASAEGADFSEATLDECVFDGARLNEARFTRASLKHARFSGANLLAADFQKATAHGTDFSRANLFRTDFGRTRFDRGTLFEGALLSQTKVLPRASG